MVDFLGQKLIIGDKVVVLAHQKTSSTLYKAKIIGVTEKRVKVRSLEESSWMFPAITYKEPNKVVKVDF